VGSLKPVKVIAAKRGAAEPAPIGLTILTLTASSCRWPVGSPQEAHFHFCGARRPAHQAYCAPHARLAYQPQRAKRV